MNSWGRERWQTNEQSVDNRWNSQMQFESHAGDFTQDIAWGNEGEAKSGEEHEMGAYQPRTEEERIVFKLKARTSIPAVYHGPIFDDTCFEFLVRVSPVSYADLCTSEFEKVSVHASSFQFSQEKEDGMLELYVKGNNLRDVMKEILFGVFEQSVITVEVERREADWKVTDEGQPISFPTLINRASFTINNAYMRKHIMLDARNKNENVEEKSKSLFLHNLPGNVNSAFLQMLFPLNVKCKVVKTSNDVKAAILEMRSVKMTLHHLAGILVFQIDDQSIQMGTAEVCQSEAIKQIAERELAAAASLLLTAQHQVTSVTSKKSSESGQFFAPSASTPSEGAAQQIISTVVEKTGFGQRKNKEVVSKWKAANDALEHMKEETVEESEGGGQTAMQVVSQELSNESTTKQSSGKSSAWKHKSPSDFRRDLARRKQLEHKRLSALPPVPLFPPSLGTENLAAFESGGSFWGSGDHVGQYQSPATFAPSNQYFGNEYTGNGTEPVHTKKKNKRPSDIRRDQGRNAAYKQGASASFTSAAALRNAQDLAYSGSASRAPYMQTFATTRWQSQSATTAMPHEGPQNAIHNLPGTGRWRSQAKIERDRKRMTEFLEKKNCEVPRNAPLAKGGSLGNNSASSTAADRSGFSHSQDRFRWVNPKVNKAVQFQNQANQPGKNNSLQPPTKDRSQRDFGFQSSEQERHPQQDWRFPSSTQEDQTKPFHALHQDSQRQLSGQRNTQPQLDSESIIKRRRYERDLEEDPRPEQFYLNDDGYDRHTRRMYRESTPPLPEADFLELERRHDRDRYLEDEIDRRHKDRLWKERYNYWYAEAERRLADPRWDDPYY